MACTPMSHATCISIEVVSEGKATCISIEVVSEGKATCMIKHTVFAHVQVLRVTLRLPVP